MAKYKHFKGAVYEVICEAIHSETDEKLVIYKNSEGTTFARPYDSFFDTVQVNGKVVPRFTKVS